MEEAYERANWRRGDVELGDAQVIGYLMATLLPLNLPDGIRSRMIADVNGLDMHVLEAGEKGKPLLILLHGFPEIAYSYRHVMLPLASKLDAYVVAPDLRGFGRTTGWSAADTASFKMFNLVTDVIALAYSLGYSVVRSIIGHDFGSRVAAYCALVRPDLFKSAVIMSAPFPGPPRSNLLPSSSPAPNIPQILSDLRSLSPARKHYAEYFCDPSLVANRDMMNPAQGLHSFFLGYFHMKSADWSHNDPKPLKEWSAFELAKLPEYYVMPVDKSMPEVVLPHTPSVAPPWLTEEDLAVFAGEYGRTTFQGGLNFYNYRIIPQVELFPFMNKLIDVPVLFVCGEKDWGRYNSPGELDRMRLACPKMAPGNEGCKFIKGAGHWVQQERPKEVVDSIFEFLNRI